MKFGLRYCNTGHYVDPLSPMPGMAAWIGNADEALAWRERIDQYRDL
jgi:hypothetical protein|tara:strand:- start:554 stop:694 length:141 start_codon:yes stop_codon:yes gene_type:complete